MNRAERRAQARARPKDNTYIYQEKRWIEHIRKLVPKIDAGVALILKRKYHMSKEQIMDILQGSQALWQADGKDFDILDACAREVGIGFGTKGGN